MSEKIIKNRAYCKKCHEEISSASVHHFNTCRCGAISVDGGQEYLRRIGDPSNFVDTSIVIQLPDPPAKYKVGQKVLDSDGNVRVIIDVCRPYAVYHYTLKPRLGYPGDNVIYHTEDQLKPYENRKRLPKVRTRSV